MDNLKFFLGIGLAIVLVFFGASVYTRFGGDTTGPVDRETLYQVSTIDALMQGVFDGIQPVGELKTHGDFGIGTFDALDGEMIVLDGVVYQAKADGHIYRASDSLTTPFATVTYFDRDRTATTGKADELFGLLDIDGRGTALTEHGLCRADAGILSPDESAVDSGAADTLPHAD